MCKKITKITVGRDIEYQILGELLFSNKTDSSVFFATLYCQDIVVAVVTLLECTRMIRYVTKNRILSHRHVLVPN